MLKYEQRKTNGLAKWKNLKYLLQLGGKLITFLKCVKTISSQYANYHDVENNDQFISNKIENHGNN